MTDLATAPAKLSGHVVFLYAFDIAYEMLRAPLPPLLGQSPTPFTIDPTKRAPRQFLFYRPDTLRLPPIDRPSSVGPVRIEREVKIFAIGALSITFRIPFSVDKLSDLVPYHDLRLADSAAMHDEALALAEQVRKELAPFLIRPVDRLADEEAYTLFCISSPLEHPGPTPAPAENWLAVHRREVAALLTEEPNLANLSDQETDESTSRYLSYYDRDLLVIDWDAALVVDEPKYIDEMIYLLELANIQLAELEAYDRLLETVIDRAYRDLARGLAPRRPRRWTGKKTLKDLREIRIDLARFSDELSNITKFFGDWHLARTYQAAAARFHLADWHAAIDEKLKTLDNLYQLLQADRNHRTMLFLELTMILLFILDVVLLLRLH